MFLFAPTFTKIFQRARTFFPPFSKGTYGGNLYLDHLKLYNNFRIRNYYQIPSNDMLAWLITIFQILTISGVASGPRLYKTFKLLHLYGC